MLVCSALECIYRFNEYALMTFEKKQAIDLESSKCKIKMQLDDLKVKK